MSNSRLRYELSKYHFRSLCVTLKCLSTVYESQAMDEEEANITKEIGRERTVAR